MSAIPDDTQREFFSACKKNQVAVASAMLDQHSALVGCLRSENNAVAYVCMQVNTHGTGLPGTDGHQDVYQMVDMLLRRGVDPNFRGNEGVLTALHYAANANDAASQADIVRLLLQYGANPGARIEWDPGYTILGQRPRPPAAVAALIEDAAGIRLDFQQQQAAAAAAAAAAADQGPEPEPESHVNSVHTAYPGLGPAAILMKAIKYAREEHVGQILAEHRDEVVNKACGTYAPVEHVALLMHLCAPVTPGLDEEHTARRRYWQDSANGTHMMEMLLAQGENPNRRGSTGSISAIQYAAEGNDRDLVVLLLAYGADPTLKDLDGWSALSVSERAKNHGMVEILQAGSEIQAHFQATGRHEWPIVIPPPAPAPAPAALVRTHTEYVPQLEPSSEFGHKMVEIRERCLQISKQNGRKHKQQEIYKAGVPCHVPQPPVDTDDRAAPSASAADKAAYVAEREGFIAASVQQLAGTNPHDWRHRTLQIKFSLGGSWQQGQDWGGLTKAFVKLMSECLFDADLPSTLFVPMSDDSDVPGLPLVSSLWRMKTDSELASIDGWEGRMRWVGQFLAYCLWTGELANIPVLPSVYGFLLECPRQWRDLMLDDPKLYQNMLTMLDGTPEYLEMLYQNMAVLNADMTEEPLVDGGCDIDVTQENVREYVELSSMHKMFGVCERGLAELQRGFGDIIDAETLRDSLQAHALSPCELRMMVCGVAEIDVDALRDKTRYRGGSPDMQKALWFFEVLAGWQSGEPMCDDPEVAAAMSAPFGPANKLVLRVVEYATGNDRAPAGGWGNLRDKGGNKCPLTLYNLDDDDKRNQMPRAHTCFNKIDLPDYDSRANLARELWRAVSYGMGFGDA